MRMAILQKRKVFIAPNRDGQNFIQNMLPPTSKLSLAKMDSNGGTSINPTQGGCLAAGTTFSSGAARKWGVVK